MERRAIGPWTTRLILVAALAAMPWAGHAAEAAKSAVAAPGAKQVDRGRYLVMIGGCNDCHTAGFAPSGGKTPERDWLKGDILGFRGPWGTTYPANLRIYMEKLSEDQWVKTGKALQTRPPMPWFNVNAMTEPDLRALYRYVRSLKPAGDPAPAYVPPDQEPKPPFIQWPAPPK